VKGKRWLPLSRWVNLTAGKRQELNQLFALNRIVFKAYLLKESLDPLRRCDAKLPATVDRSAPRTAAEALSETGGESLDHLDGIPITARRRYLWECWIEREYPVTATPRTRLQEPALPTVELKAQRMAATKTEFVVFNKAA
jgi:hypothetical protein